MPCGRRIHGNGLWNCWGKKISMWCSVRMSGDVSTVSPSLTDDRREVFNGSRMGKEFSANVFNDYFKWLENIPEKERGGHSATELRQHHRHESGSTLELAAGILSMETNPRDYEEEAFARRMKKKKKTGRKRGI